MFFTFLYRSRKRITLLLLFLFVFTVSYSNGEPENTSSGHSRETIIFNLNTCINFSGSFNSGENKVPQVNILLVMMNQVNKTKAILRSAAYINTFNNESIINFRLRSFVTSHFSTST